jgi:hypothetical protein
VLDESHDFPQRCNRAMVDLEPVEEREDRELVRDLLTQHAAYTGSPVAMRLLKEWEQARTLFVKVMPLDYRRILMEQNSAAAIPDPLVLDQWWHERYPGHLRSTHSHTVPAGADRPMSVEVARG